MAGHLLWVKGTSLPIHLAVKTCFISFYRGPEGGSIRARRPAIPATRSGRRLPIFVPFGSVRTEFEIYKGTLLWIQRYFR